MTGVEAASVLGGVAGQFGFNAALVLVLLGGVGWIGRWIVTTLVTVVTANTRAMESISTKTDENTRAAERATAAVTGLEHRVAIMSERLRAA